LLQGAHFFGDPWEFSGFVFPEIMMSVNHVAEMLKKSSWSARSMLAEPCHQWGRGRSSSGG
jgi:hypothetical protein